MKITNTNLAYIASLIVSLGSLALVIFLWWKVPEWTEGVYVIHFMALLIFLVTTLTLVMTLDDNGGKVALKLNFPGHDKREKVRQLKQQYADLWLEDITKLSDDEVVRINQKAEGIKEAIKLLK